MRFWFISGLRGCIADLLSHGGTVDLSGHAVKAMYFLTIGDYTTVAVWRLFELNGHGTEQASVFIHVQTVCRRDSISGSADAGGVQWKKKGNITF